MESTIKVVCCIGNQHLCHIAEAYFRYFSQGKIIVSYLEPDHETIHPKVQKTLLEDGINWEDLFPQSAAVSKQPDFYFVMGAADLPEFRDSIPVIRHDAIELPANFLQNGNDNQMEFRRESVKKAVLKFIGKEL